MADNPSLFPRVWGRDEEGPGAAAAGARRHPVSRLIGAFIGLCQFGKKWSDMMGRMGPSPKNGMQNGLQNLGERPLSPCHLGLQLVSQRCA